MSGVVKGVKKLVKGVGKFVKKYWRPILAVAAVTFTAGLATVGTAGFAAAGGGSGIGATLGAIGKTMVAGVQAIGGSLGIGKGANLAAFGGTGTATLGTGAAAQALGFAPTGAAGAGTAANLAAGAGAGGVGPTAALANPAALSGGAGPAAAAASRGVATAAGAAPSATPFTSSFLSSPAGQILTNAGVGFVNSYMQARAMEDAAEDAKPLALWGVPLRREGGRESGIVSMQQEPMWSPQSFQRPAAPALMSPNNPTDPNWDPTRGYFGG